MKRADAAEPLSATTALPPSSAAALARPEAVGAFEDLSRAVKRAAAELAEQTRGLVRERLAPWLARASDPDALAAAVTEIGPRLRRTRKIQRILAFRIARRLADRPDRARSLAAGAAAVWLLGAVCFGGLWLAATALTGLWAVYVAQRPDPAWD